MFISFLPECQLETYRHLFPSGHWQKKSRPHFLTTGSGPAAIFFNGSRQNRPAFVPAGAGGRWDGLTAPALCAPFLTPGRSMPGAGCSGALSSSGRPSHIPCALGSTPGFRVCRSSQFTLQFGPTHDNEVHANKIFQAAYLRGEVLKNFPAIPSSNLYKQAGVPPLAATERGGTPTPPNSPQTSGSVRQGRFCACLAGERASLSGRDQ